MIDEYDNKTGQRGPDGVDDREATGPAKVTIEADKKERAKPQADPFITPDAVATVGDDDLMPDLSQVGVDVNEARSQLKADDSPKVVIGYDYSGGKVTPKYGGIDTLTGGGYVANAGSSSMRPMEKLVGKNWDAYEPIYNRAVQQAQIMQKAGKDVTVDDLLNRWANGGAPDDIKKYLSDGSGGGAGGSFSTTSKSVSLTDAGTARLVIDGALSRYLGRQATSEENKKFLAALNVQEKQNPTITKTSGYSDGSGNTSQSSTSTGGFSRDEYAQRFAQAQQGYAEYQAATTYLDAFANALESDSRVI